MPAHRVQRAYEMQLTEGTAVLFSTCDARQPLTQRLVASVLAMWGEPVPPHIAAAAPGARVFLLPVSSSTQAAPGPVAPAAAQQPTPAHSAGGAGSTSLPGPVVPATPLPLPCKELLSAAQAEALQLQTPETSSFSSDATGDDQHSSLISVWGELCCLPPLSDSSIWL